MPFVSFFLAITSSRAPPPAPKATSKPIAAQQTRRSAKRPSNATAPAKPTAPKKNQKPTFNDADMERPLNQISGYDINDYTTLPNCLDVFTECLAVPIEGKTSEQYKSATLEVAQKPCRVVLKVVDVPADYDFAEFELLTDGGESGVAALRDGGDLNSYTHYLKNTFPINHIKAKGLDAKHLSIGDRVVLLA